MKEWPYAKKLVLWHTPTFRPLMSHRDLEPILISVGFISLPAYIPPSSSSPKPPSSPDRKQKDETWKEYALPSSSWAAMAASGAHLPRPRLPFPRIYGLHLVSYKAFLSALECYIDPNDVYKLFHVRAMPITPSEDQRFEKDYQKLVVEELNDTRTYLSRHGTAFECMVEQIRALELKSQSGEENYDRRIKGSRNGRGNPADQIIMISMDILQPGIDILSSWF